MFDNVKQLENEIKDFEQNILASKELVQNVKSVAETVKQQTESLNSESRKIMRELQSVPANLRSVNEEYAGQLQEETRKVNDDFNRQIQAYLSTLELSTAEVKKYHATLTERYTDLLDQTQQKLNDASDGIETKLADKTGKLNDSLNKQVQTYLSTLEFSTAEVKQYHADLTVRCTELLDQTQKKLDEVSNGIEIKLTKETGELNDSLNKQVRAYLETIEGSTADVKKYHETLTTRYDALLAETQKEMNTAIVKASASFKAEAEKYTNELVASVEELKRYESSMNNKYDALIKESEQLHAKVTTVVTEIKNAVNSKMTILMVLVIICIVLSAVGLFM